MENKKEQVMRETKLLVNLFLKTNASDMTLSKMTKISSSTVGRRLTNKEIIMMCFPEKGETIYNIIKEKRKYNLQRGKIIGNQTSILNNVELNSSTPKLRLDVIFKDYTKQMTFLTHLILYFHVHLPLLCELFNFNEREIHDKLIEFNANCTNSLLYLFTEDTFDQELAKKRVVEYYKDLIDAISKNDMITRNVLIGEIDDKKVKELKVNHYKGDIKSDEEILIYLEYQLKYSLSITSMGSKYNFESTTYANRVRNILNSKINDTKLDEDLRRKYELYLQMFNKLADYNKEKSKNR